MKFMAGENGWKALMPVVIPYGWNTEADDIEIVITQGGDKPRKFEKKDMLDVPAYGGYELYSDVRVLVLQERVSDEQGSMTVSYTYRQTQPVLSRIFYLQQPVPSITAVSR